LIYTPPELEKIHSYIWFAKQNFRCFNQPAEPNAQLELLPNEKDGLSPEEAKYLADKYFVFSVCKGDLQAFETWWNEKNYYELFEKYIFLTTAC
jgi:hypothetical protein